MATLTNELVIGLTSIEGFKEDSVILCSKCGNEINIEYFKDDLSLEFFDITGQCQNCQDDVFDDNDKII